VTATPWGPSQSSKSHARGIVEYSCAGHGGFHLSSTRNAQVHATWRDSKGWYEEDCDYAIVVFTFPEYFDENMRKGARASLKDYNPDAYMIVTGEIINPSESYTLRKREAQRKYANSYVTVSAYGDWHSAVPKGMVGVFAARGGYNERGHWTDTKQFLVPEEEYQPGPIGFVVDESRFEEYDFLSPRCTDHDDCKASPKLAIACMAQRSAS
jgi:hypothetical protein